MQHDTSKGEILQRACLIDIQLLRLYGSLITKQVGSKASKSIALCPGVYDPWNRI